MCNAIVQRLIST